MDLARIARHIFVLPGAVGRALPAAAMAEIEAAIRRSETGHRGEIRFAAEGALEMTDLLAGETARERAIDVFALLRVWDTEENNGVLVYLLLADHDVEIVADRGINTKVPAGEWQRICQRMEAAFRRGEFKAGVLAGIDDISALLARHYPPRAGDRNELSNKPAVL
jgi:uncharacterized membrane protein YgcG